jgi:sRNA-binding protein
MCLSFEILPETSLRRRI